MKSTKEVKKTLFDFLKLKELTRIAIISDNDEDGLTAAVQAKLFFDKKKIESKVLFYDHTKQNGSFSRKEFVDFNPEKTIFIDLSENFVFDILEHVGDFTGDFVIIDHHRGIEVVNSHNKFLTIKPTEFSDKDPSKYPASKMIYDLLEGKDWLAAIGIIGDFSSGEWKKFVEKAAENNNIKVEQLEELAKIIACVVSVHCKKTYSLFEFLLKSKKPGDLFKSNFFPLAKSFFETLEKETKRFEKDVEKIDLDLYFFETQKNLQSKLSNMISQNHPHNTIFVYAIEEDFVKGSMRRQDFKFDCNLATRFALDGIENATGGGHIPATGCRFPIDYFDTFKAKLLKYAKKNYRKQ